MRSLKKIFKNYWDVFGGVFFGITTAILVKCDIEKIQLIYSIIILILILIGFMKVIFRKNKEDKSELLIDKFVDIQKPMKAIDISENPTKEGEELGYIILDQMKGWKKTMQKIKNFFKWIWLYKEQIIGLLAVAVYACITVYAYVFDKFGWLLQYFPQTAGWAIAVKISVAVLSVVFIYYIVRNQVKHVGIGGFDYATEVLKEKTKKINSSLSATSQEFVKNAIDSLKATLKEKQNLFEELKKQYYALYQEVKSAKELLEYGVGNNEEFVYKQQELSRLNNELNKAEKEVLQVEQQIKDREKVLYS